VKLGTTKYLPLVVDIELGALKYNPALFPYTSTLPVSLAKLVLFGFLV
jgi:hypothetical protein